MKLGNYKHRIEIQAPSEVRTGAQAKTEYTTTVATVWASVIQLQGARLEKSKAIHSELTTEVRIRYRTGITGQHRFKIGNRYLYPVSPPIDVEDRHAELLILCKESDG
jgi:SPP1 family predicted phage head-tail adaptor